MTRLLPAGREFARVLLAGAILAGLGNGLALAAGRHESHVALASRSARPPAAPGSRRAGSRVRRASRPAESRVVPASEPTAESRVVLDRLTWCPDRRHLAVEAVWEGPDATFRDTLLVDLEQGSLSMRTVRPRRIAFDEAGGAVVAADRYSILYGSSDHPDSARVLAAWNPVNGEVDRLGFSQAGDSVLIQSRPLDSRWYDITAVSVGTGRQRLISRVSHLRESDSTWTRLGAAGQAMAVRSIPFSTFYMIAAGGVFHLERSDRGPVREGAWTYDLHWRDVETGNERIIARGVAPWATAPSPDGKWVALAGSISRPDYGGESIASLSLTSADGNVFFTVQPEDVRTDAPVEVTAMAWHRGALWYTTPEGMFRLDPGHGRSRRVSIGPAPAAWSDSLGPPAQVRTLILPDAFGDSATALDIQEKLRRSGHPAWVMGKRNGPFRVAVGAVDSTVDLEEIAVRLSRGGVDDFEIESLPASGNGVPFPHGRVHSPDGEREAYLTEIGPPGFRAGELWVSEQRGARQVRLIRAMLRVDTTPR